MLLRQIKKFFAEEEAQDLIEYTLLIGLILLSSAAILVAGSANVQGIWGIANTQLAAANAAS